MDKNPDRNEFMKNQLNQYSTNYTRIKGFNGYEIKNKLNDTVDDISFIIDKTYNNMEKAEIGCTMSHLIAMKTSYENGDDIALIIEDDTMVHLASLNDFDEIINNAPYNWEIIQLSCFNWDFNKILLHPNKILLNHNESQEDFLYYKYVSPYYFNSTVGYIINRKGMKKILDHTYKGEVGKNNSPLFYIGPNNFSQSGEVMPHTGVADYFIYDLTNTYVLYPNIFYANNIDLESTIHTSHTDLHISRSLEIVKQHHNKIKKFINLDKINE